MIDELKKDVESLNARLIAWRRDFHRYPEVAFKERRTSTVIHDFLEGLDLKVQTLAGTGLRAVLEGNPGERTVALRADMDALPLIEEGDKEYISQNPGATHACAHDGHMAILMGVAHLLSKWKNRFNGKVVFLFQPAEEQLPGGAKPMIEEGALEGAQAIFGLHLWQLLPTGTVGIIKGPMMAQADNFRIAVRGKGGHGSMPQLTVDPILAAAQIVVNLQSVVSRNVDPLKPAVLSFGKVEGGTVNNIIPEEVRLVGTVRTFDPPIQALIEKRLGEIVIETGKAFGAEASVEYELGYPAVVNPPSMVDFVTEVTSRILGAEKIKAIDPVMGGEDFSLYLQEIPGAFLFFGAGDGKKFPHHHPAFDIDERALPQATLLMTCLALEFLKRNA